MKLENSYCKLYLIIHNIAVFTAVFWSNKCRLGEKTNIFWVNFKLAHKACPSDAKGVSAITSLSALVHNDLSLNSLITSLFSLSPSYCHWCDGWQEASLHIYLWEVKGGISEMLWSWVLKGCMCDWVSGSSEGMVIACMCSRRGCTLFASGWWRATYAHWSDRGLMFN